MGRAAALDILKSLPPRPTLAEKAEVAMSGRAPVVDGEKIDSLRRLMTDHVGVIRDAQGLDRALEGITALEPDAPLALANMLAAARMITAAAFLRRESRGAHCRADFPGILAPRPSLMTLSDAISLKEPA
jgi:L-aspartate oxidase